MRIAVIGAGPAGMTAAYKLSGELGLKLSQLDIYEKSEQVGGLSKSLDLWGQIVDLGPHRFFSHDPEINALWLEVVNGSYDIVDRQTRIFYKKRFFDYPIRALNALQGLGIFEAIRCVISYMVTRIRPTRDTSTFEGWVTSRFGKRLYTIFFKTYSEKLWGIPCSQLDSDFASQRIKKLSLFEAIRNALFQGRGNKHATLVDQFAYPEKGTGWVYESMKARIEERGGNVYLNKGVERAVCKEGRISGLQLESGEVIEYDHVISTMPMTHLVERLPDIPDRIRELAGKLRFRNTILVYLKVEATNIFPDQWLYIHDPSVEFGRVSNFRNWLPSLYGSSQSSILCLEYWCDFEEESWKRDDESTIRLAKQEVAEAGLVAEELISEGKVVRLPRCYPVYFRSYREVLTPLEEYLQKLEGLHVIGRYGAYKYNNQDHSLLMGMRAAENILGKAQHNLWSINTDYEVYQESSVITKTGLLTQSNPKG